MLTQSTLNVIALLLERNNHYNSRNENVCMDMHEYSHLQDLLMQSGLLNVTGELNKPIEQISLFEVLASLNEPFYISARDDERPYISHSMETLDKSFCLWLKSIKLNEL